LDPPTFGFFLTGETPVFARILIPERCAGSGRTTVHTTTFLTANSRLPAESTGPGLGAAARTTKHRRRIALMITRHWRPLYLGTLAYRTFVGDVFGSAATPSRALCVMLPTIA